MNIINMIFKRGMEKMINSVYGITDVGKQRNGNEDNYIILSRHGIYAVADGVGGHNAGEVASLNVIKTIKEYFTMRRISEMRKNIEIVEKEMIQSIMEAHKRIIEESNKRAEYAGMGSTIAMAFIHNGILHTCHVGDSRVYVINQSGITQITNDHSVVAEMVQLGKMTKEEAWKHPMKNQITQALGAPFPLRPEYNQRELGDGDLVLICSDGLWDMLMDNEIYDITMSGETLEESCKKLIEQANNAGGDDNITVILIRASKKVGD